MVRINEELDEMSILKEQCDFLAEEENDEFDSFVEDSCDFSETNMMENALVMPMNSQASNRKSPMTKAQILEKRRSKSQYRMHVASKPKSSLKASTATIEEEEDDNAIIEYDFVLPVLKSSFTNVKTQEPSLVKSEEKPNLPQASKPVQKHFPTDPESLNTNFTTNISPFKSDPNSSEASLPVTVRTLFLFLEDSQSCDDSLFVG